MAELKGTSHASPITDVVFPRAYSELFASCGGSDIRVWHAASLSELLRIQARARARGGGRDGWGGYGRGGGGTVLDDCHVLARRVMFASALTSCSIATPTASQR